MPSETLAPSARASNRFRSMRGAYHVKRLLNIHADDGECEGESTRQTQEELAAAGFPYIGRQLACPRPWREAYSVQHACSPACLLAAVLHRFSSRNPHASRIYRVID